MGLMDKGDPTIDQVEAQDARLDSRTLQLLEILSDKSPVLADMLKGAWDTLNGKENPDMLPQVCHSMRELVEKAPLKIPEVPIDKDDPGTRKVQIIAMIRTLNGPAQAPAQFLTTQIETLWPLREFFVDVAHHNKPDATFDDVRSAIVSLENCLLNLFKPQPIADLDELDILLAEGEAL